MSSLPYVCDIKPDSHSLVCVCVKSMSFSKKQSSGFVPHRSSMCLSISLKPLHSIQELPNFVCCELCSVCVFLKKIVETFSIRHYIL